MRRSAETVRKKIKSGKDKALRRATVACRLTLAVRVVGDQLRRVRRHAGHGYAAGWLYIPWRASAETGRRRRRLLRSRRPRAQIAERRQRRLISFNHTGKARSRPHAH